MKKCIHSVLNVMVVCAVLFTVTSCTSNTVASENQKEYYKLSFYAGGEIPQTLTSDQMMADIDRLQLLVSDCYVNYDYLRDEKLFNFDDAFANMRLQCWNAESMKNKDFVKLVDDCLFGWPDRHVGLFGKGMTEPLSVIKHFDFYSSSIVVKKTGENYIVVSSNEDAVPKGVVY